jgi:DNA-binding NarL/FixJ family response regulator
VAVETAESVRQGVVKVVIVDDHALIRDAVRLALRDEAMIEVCGEARTAEEALSVARATAPDVIVLDYRLPDADAPEVIVRLREQGTAAEIVVLTSYGEQRNVRAAIDSGARAFLTKRATDIDGLAGAVMSARQGRETFSEDALSALLGSIRNQARRAQENLTPRETEVWQLVALGKSNATIARELFVSERTAKYHVSNLLEKTGAASRTELVSLAYRSGLMDCRV